MNMHAARATSGLDTLKTILGIPVLAIRWNDAVSLLNCLIAERRFTKVSFLNAHNANLASTDPAFAEALDDFLILPDGIGVDLAAKLLYGAPFPDNLNGTDFVPAFLQASTTPLTVGLLGATRVNAEAASAKLAALAVQHRFVVIHDGYFSAAEEAGIVDRIEELRPDVLSPPWVYRARIVDRTPSIKSLHAADRSRCIARFRARRKLQDAPAALELLFRLTSNRVACAATWSAILCSATRRQAKFSRTSEAAGHPLNAGSRRLVSSPSSPPDTDGGNSDGKRRPI